MQQEFSRYISQHGLVPANSRILAAVSGGIDSMAMLHLLVSTGINCAVAHCNFCLRNDESDGDESFVRQTASEFGIPIHVIRFNTNEYALKKSISIQMAARELRYQWFDKLSRQYDYHLIAIAHNRDDRAETLFINLARGTGIRGLTSIKPKNGKIIRPLLFASRHEIAGYVRQNNIVFREDSSNASDHYARNYIRHQLIPGLKNYFPGILQTMERNMEHFADVESLYASAVKHFKQQLIKKSGNQYRIDMQGLIKSPSPPTLLYEMLKPFGFSNAIIPNILESTALNHSGRQFFSHTHRLVCNRQYLIVECIKNRNEQTYLIESGSMEISIPVRLKIDTLDATPEYKPDTSPDAACLDAAKLLFPLMLRRWQQGDVFYPLGMKNMKKVSDFFIDNKLSIIDKEQVWLLTSAGKIVWIVGYRIDNRFKITHDTQKIIKIKYIVS
jgi:tRNA(Ile)-lysidine synthase